MIKTGLTRQGEQVYINRNAEGRLYVLYSDRGMGRETWYLCYDRAWRRAKTHTCYFSDEESAYDFAAAGGCFVAGPPPNFLSDIPKDYEELDQSPQEI